MTAERMKATDQVAPARTADVYDVRFPKQHRQWLVSVDNTVVSPVWLGHRTDEGLEAALVGTLPRAAFPPGANPLAWDAPGRSVGKLMDVIEPVIPGAQRSAVGKAVQQHLAQQVAALPGWPRVSWTVQGNRAEASVLHFAGAWIAITSDLLESYLVVIAVGIAPDDLEFSVTRGEECGVDFSVPLTIGTLNRLPVWQMPQPNQVEVHPDLRRFLSPGL
ncbi:hypothetical protein [Amycolatopsis sp. NPDC059021]|uniref:hypothetical protein n=1 Tax=Amycolatopsis sp. NPDC059021 TaxID=3346704 RepID=UPI00366E8E23